MAVIINSFTLPLLCHIYICSHMQIRLNQIPLIVYIIYESDLSCFMRHLCMCKYLSVYECVGDVSNCHICIDVFA